VMMMMVAHSIVRAHAWEFMNESWQNFSELYNGGGVKLLSIAKSVVNGFTTQAELDDVTSFFASHVVQGTERGVRKSIEGISANIAWLTRDRDEILGYFQSKA
ncbi:MAG: ERAP1-like C-terminal domain-containing protein, partial [bacterium]